MSGTTRKRSWAYAVAMQPTAAIPRNNLGAALVFKRNLDAAVAQFRRAVQVDPSF